MATVDKQQPKAEQEAWQIQMARFALLSEVVLLLAKTPDLNRLLTQAVNRIKWVIDFERCTLALVNSDEETYQLQTLLETRRTVPKVTEEAISLAQGIPGEVMQRKQMRLITDLSANLTEIPSVVDPAMEDGLLTTVLSLPLQAYGKMLGAITFGTTKSNGYTDGDIKVATSFATHLALAIDRWQQTQQLQQANQELARLASFPELNPGPIVEVDLDRSIHYVNPAASQVFPNLEMASSQHLLLEDLQDAMTALQDHRNDSFTDEIKIDDIWYQRVLHYVEQSERVRIYVLDITERKRAEQAIRQQNEYLAALHDTSLGLITRLDLNDLLTAIITRAGQLLGTAHGYVFLVTPDGTALERKVGLGVYSESIGFQMKPKEGVAGRVWQSGQPLAINNYDTWSGRSPDLSYDVKVRALLGVPLTQSSDIDQAMPQVVGVIGMGYDAEADRTFGEEEVELLSRFAQLASIALDNSRLYTEAHEARVEAEEQAHRLALLNEMGQQMNVAGDEKEIYKVVTDYIPQIVPADRATVALVTADGKHFEVLTLQGEEGAIPVGKSFPLDNTSAGKAILEKRVMSTPDLKASDYLDAQSLTLQGLNSNLNAPMIVGEKVIGTVNVANKNLNAYSSRDGNLLLQIASFLGTTIENLRLYQEAHEARVATEAANHDLSHALENLKTTQGQLVEAEKMAALGGLVAGVAHEINTPVGVGVTAASLLEDKTVAFLDTYQSGNMKRSDLEKYLDTASQSSSMILNNLNRAAELIQSFKQVAVDQSSEERREFPVKAYLEEILLSLRPTLKRTQHTIEINGDDSLTLDSYPGVFSQIVTNLVMNSLVHAYEPEEWGQLSFDFQQKDGRFTFEYADDGRGISEKNLNKIFDPFFTTKRGQGGSGLGLHIIYNLVTQKMGGSIRCESEVGSGTKFIIEVPVS